MKRWVILDAGGIPVQAGQSWAVPDGALEIDMPPEVVARHRLTEGGWVERDDLDQTPPAPVDAPKAEAMRELKARRNAVLSSGMLVGGIPVYTDDISQQRLTAAALAATIDPTMTLNWKSAQGVFVTLTAPQIIGIAQAVRAHVQACFDREAQLLSDINAAADPRAVDLTTGWPGREPQA